MRWNRQQETGDRGESVNSTTPHGASDTVVSHHQSALGVLDETIDSGTLESIETVAQYMEWNTPEQIGNFLREMMFTPGRGSIGNLHKKILPRTFLENTFGLIIPETDNALQIEVYFLLRAWYLLQENLQNNKNSVSGGLRAVYEQLSYHSDSLLRAYVQIRQLASFNSELSRALGSLGEFHIRGDVCFHDVYEEGIRDMDNIGSTQYPETEKNAREKNDFIKDVENAIEQLPKKRRDLLNELYKIYVQSKNPSH